MYLRRLLASATVVGLAVMAVPDRASAQWFVTPFVGGNFGGDAQFGSFNDDFDDEFERRVDFGVTAGWMSQGIIGWEVDFGFSPNFFQDTIGDANFDFGDSNVTTLMGNVLISAPIGGTRGVGIHPYGSGGVGLIRSSISAGDFFDDVSSNDFGFNVGGGVNVYFNDRVGIRGDVRYIRSFEDNEPDDEFDLALSDFDFWRASVGVTFRFGQQP
jgi:opacity protein-like surface antigen